MTRKDYVALAEALHSAQVSSETITFKGHDWAQAVWEDCRDQIADVLAADNPRFDRERFVRACQGDK